MSGFLVHGEGLGRRTVGSGEGRVLLHSEGMGASPSMTDAHRNRSNIGDAHAYGRGRSILVLTGTWRDEIANGVSTVFLRGVVTGISDITGAPGRG